LLLFLLFIIVLLSPKANAQLSSNCQIVLKQLVDNCQAVARLLSGIQQAVVVVVVFPQAPFRVTNVPGHASAGIIQTGNCTLLLLLLFVIVSLSPKANAVVKQLSSSSQRVGRKLSGSRKDFVRHSRGSRQAVIRQSSDSILSMN
jgi:hypothetical protein